MRTVNIGGSTAEYDETRAFIGDNGIPRCKECGCELFSPVYIIRGLPPQIFRFKCECEKEESKEELRRKELIKRAEIQTELSIPLKYRFAKSFDDIDYSRDPKQRKIADICMAFINDSRYYNLCMLGSIGTGKTLCAYIMAIESMLKGKHAIVTTESRMLDEIQNASYKGKRMDKLDEYASVPFLVIDEIGRTKPKDIDTNRKMLFDIINDRTDWQKKTVLISNLRIYTEGDRRIDEFTDYIGVATADRLKEGKMPVPLMNWASYRSN